MDEVSAEKPAAKKRVSLRNWNRILHRDLGNLCVGLTFVYALSGLAVNHIADWEPSFKDYSRTVEIGGPLPSNDDDAAKVVMEKLHIEGDARDVYREGDKLEITLDKRTLHVDTKTGHVVDEGQEPRFFLRAANWLHLNRGKKAWTYVADFYAAGLLVLALSGIFMLPGKKGLFGRGGVFVALGAAIPIAYVAWSGGLEKKPERKAPPAMEAR